MILISLFVSIALQDVNGALYKPLETKMPTAILFVSVDCPISNAYAPEIKRLEKSYRTKGIRFFLVQSDPEITAADAKKHATEYGFMSTILLDPKHRLVDKLSAKVTPEAFVMDKTGAIVYCGRIDDRYADIGTRRMVTTTHELRDALDAVLKGKKPKVSKTEAVGCAIY